MNYSSSLHPIIKIFQKFLEWIFEFCYFNSYSLKVILYVFLKSAPIFLSSLNDVISFIIHLVYLEVFMAHRNLPLFHLP